MADVIRMIDAAGRRDLRLSRLLCGASGIHVIAMEGPGGAVFTGQGRTPDQALWNAVKAEREARREAVNA